MRALIPVLVLLLSCSGTDGDSSTVVETNAEAAPAEVTEVPAESLEAANGDELEAETRCEADDQCEMYAFCCACPRTAEAMHVEEADRQREQCTRVRCAACGIEAPPETRVARCVDGACVAVEPQ